MLYLWKKTKATDDYECDKRIQHQNE